MATLTQEQELAIRRQKAQQAGMPSGYIFKGELSPEDVAGFDSGDKTQTLPVDAGVQNNEAGKSWLKQLWDASGWSPVPDVYKPGDIEKSASPYATAAGQTAQQFGQELLNVRNLALGGLGKIVGPLANAGYTGAAKVASLLNRGVGAGFAADAVYNTPEALKNVVESKDLASAATNVGQLASTLGFGGIGAHMALRPSVISGGTTGKVPATDGTTVNPDVIKPTPALAQLAQTIPRAVSPTPELNRVVPSELGLVTEAPIERPVSRPPAIKPTLSLAGKQPNPTNPEAWAEHTGYDPLTMDLAKPGMSPRNIAKVYQKAAKIVNPEFADTSTSPKEFSETVQTEPIDVKRVTPTGNVPDKLPPGINVLEGYDPNASAPVPRIPGVETKLQLATEPTLFDPTGGRLPISKMNKIVLEVDPVMIAERVKVDPSAPEPVRALQTELAESGMKIKTGSGESGFIDIGPAVRKVRDLARSLGIKSHTEFLNFTKKYFPWMGTRLSTATFSGFGPGDIVKESRQSRLEGMRDVATFKSGRDVLEDSGTPEGRLAASSFKELHEIARVESKPRINKIFEVLDKVGAKASDEALKVMYDESVSRTSLRHTITDPGVLKAYDVMREVYKEAGENRIRKRIPVYDEKTGQYRLTEIDPLDHPNMVAPEVDNIYRRSDPAALAAQEKLSTKWIEHGVKMGLTPHEAKARLESFIQSRKASGTTSPEFAGNRLAAGTGLPPEWIDTNAHRVMKRYFDRYGRDVAWHEVVQSRPDVARVWGEKFDSWGKPVNSTLRDISSSTGIQDLKNEFMRTVDFSDPMMGTSAKVFNNLGMAQLTSLRNIWQNAVHAYHYGMSNPGEALKISKALFEIRSGIKKALGTGNISLEMGNSRAIFDSMTGAGDFVGHAATTFGKYVGMRTIGERISRGMTQSLGEVVGQILTEKSLKGDKYAKRILHEVNPEGKTLNPIELGSRISRMWEGTYSQLDVPTWMQKQSALFDAFRLFRWSAARTRYVNRHIITPAVTKGDFGPLLKYTLAGMVGGEVINQLNQQLLGSKQRLPNIAELRAAGSKDTKLWAYNFSQMAAASSLLGIYSDAIKSAFDISIGGPERNRWLQIPAFEMARSVSSHLTQGVTALAEAETNEEKMGIIGVMFSNIAKDNVQAWRAFERLALRDPAKEQYRTDVRDLRAYRIASGVADPDYGSQVGNPYKDLAAKEFKQTEDPARAFELSRGLVGDVISSSQGRPDIIKRKLGSLRNIPNQGFPSEPVEISPYLSYLNRLNPGEGREKLVRYIKRKQLNEYKKAMIPKLD